MSSVTASVVADDVLPAASLAVATRVLTPWASAGATRLQVPPDATALPRIAVPAAVTSATTTLLPAAATPDSVGWAMSVRPSASEAPEPPAASRTRVGAPGATVSTTRASTACADTLPAASVAVAPRSWLPGARPAV